MGLIVEEDTLTVMPPVFTRQKPPPLPFVVVTEVAVTDDIVRLKEAVPVP